MKAKVITFIFLIAGLVSQSYLAEAQVAYAGKQNKMSVQGTSSLHEWESEVTSVECKGSVTIDNNQLVDIKNVQVKIPVTSIKSTKGRIMDNKTYEAFNSDKNPTIIYKLTSAKISGSGEYTVVAAGTLTMAGVTKPIDLTAKARVLANGDLHIVGNKKLSMKDWSMTPPTAMMGTIKVGDEVTVNFEILLTPETKLTSTK
jgi:polyisoprenoid-binding protein YceI